MRDIKCKCGGHTHGWVWLAIVLLLIGLSWEAGARELTVREFGQEIQRLKQQGKLDTRWLVTYMPFGMRGFEKTTGTGSEELSQCIEQGMRFLGHRPGLDLDKAVFMCERECVLAQDNSGGLDCLWVEWFNASGQKIELRR